ncbi:protein kinase domain-containing protein [Candidatus Uabimicrobium amorphum]|uniref:Serine/threonine protein kinase n=1 Tax=Uabimicrobium amorphum TaxID=2596890 RepID=A0A5S9IQJ1_UABAM|nr:protein kinase [Candidatus Uabimicrobium amorphum]BBM86263.1 serine/threonine protein kinase [Candidatus Uabimicrobium amorphum]
MDEKQFRTLWSKVVTPEVLDSDKISETYKSESMSYSHNITVFPQQQTFSDNGTIHSHNPSPADTFSEDGTVHCETPVDQATFSTRETTSPKDKAQIQTSLPAEEDYENYQEINRGGMGIIYKAEQKKLKREIAIKKTLPQMEKNKFVAESLVTAYLDHPNIVPIYEMDQNNNGDILLAMKLVKGVSWKDLLYPQTAEHKEKANEYNLQKHLEILINVCNAVNYAHSKGIVHCDLKPENIMIGDFGEVLVMDWGIAVDVHENFEKRTFHKSDITTPMGTPCYMSPELAEGRGKDISYATDIYLLGAILYEILQRQPPHTGKSMWLVLLAAKENKPVIFDASVPFDLQQICHKAMAKESGQRYTNINDFILEIEAYLTHQESIKIAHIGIQEIQISSNSFIYENLSRIIFRFERALEIWNKNKIAYKGIIEARIAYMRLALLDKKFALARRELGKLLEIIANTYVEKHKLISAEQRKSIFFLSEDLDSMENLESVLSILKVSLYTLLFIGTFVIFFTIDPNIGWINFAIAFLLCIPVLVRWLGEGFKFVLLCLMNLAIILSLSGFATYVVESKMTLHFPAQWKLFWFLAITILMLIPHRSKKATIHKKLNLNMKTLGNKEVNIKKTISDEIANLEHEDSQKRLKAQKTLIEIGQPSLPLLFEAASTESTPLRYNAIKTISQIDIGSRMVKNFILQRLKMESDEKIREQIRKNWGFLQENNLSPISSIGFFLLNTFVALIFAISITIFVLVLIKKSTFEFGTMSFCLFFITISGGHLVSTFWKKLVKKGKKEQGYYLVK